MAMSEPMNQTWKYLLWLWPGVGGVLRQGRWSFLVIALLYGFALCGTIAANFYWSEVLTGFFRTLSCGAMGVLWLVLSGKSAAIEKRCRKLRTPPPPEKDGLPDAQRHYLQGNWFEAECCLSMLLQNNPRDVQAMLMLATLYRHKERYEEASRLLRELELLEDAIPWKAEIRSEKRKLIAKAARKSKGSRLKTAAENAKPQKETSDQPASGNESGKSKYFNENDERPGNFDDDNENDVMSKQRLAA